MNKYKKLAANTLIFSLGSFSSKILSILLLRLYTEYMTKADYSVATQIQNIINLLGPVVTLSISESILRYGLNKKYNRKNVYSTGVITGLTGMAVGMIVLWLITSFTRFKPYLPLMMIFLFTSEFRWMQQQYTKVRNCLKLYTVDSILSTISLVLFSLLFMVVFEMGIKGYILSIIMSDLCSVFFLMYFARMMPDLKPAYVDEKLRKNMIRYSIPLIPTAVLWWVVSSSDLFMVAKFRGDEINGLYSCAYKIPNLISFVSVIFFRAWQISAITEYNSKERAHYYTKVFGAYVSMMFVASSGIMMLLRPVTKFLTAEEFWDSFRMAPFLVVGVLMQSFCNFLSSIYNAANNNTKSLTTSALAACINLALNLILIPIVGVQGAAFATMAAYLVCFITRLYDTQKIAGYRVDFNNLIINLCILVFMAVVILADAPFMTLWLVVGFIATLAVNLKSLLETASKLLRR